MTTAELQRHFSMRFTTGPVMTLRGSLVTKANMRLRAIFELGSCDHLTQCMFSALIHGYMAAFREFTPPHCPGVDDVASPLPKLCHLPRGVLMHIVEQCGTQGPPNPVELAPLRAVCRSVSAAASEEVFWRPFVPPSEHLEAQSGGSVSLFAQRMAALTPPQRRTVRACYRHEHPPVAQVAPEGSPSYDVDRAQVQAGRRLLGDDRWGMNDDVPTVRHLLSLRDWNEVSGLSPRLLDDIALGRLLIELCPSNFGFLSARLRADLELAALACHGDAENARFIPSGAGLTEPVSSSECLVQPSALDPAVEANRARPAFALWDTVRVLKGRRFGDVQPGMVGQVVHLLPGRPMYYAVAIAEADVCDIWEERHLDQPWTDAESFDAARGRGAPKAHLMAEAGFSVRRGVGDEVADVEASAHHASEQLRRQSERCPALRMAIPRGFARKHGIIYEQELVVRGPIGARVVLNAYWFYARKSGGPRTATMLIAMPVAIVPHDANQDNG